MKKMQYTVLWALSLFLLYVPHKASAFELMGERTALFEKRHYQSLTGFAAMDYYLLKPVNYNPQKQYPLVLNLHGASGHSIGAYVLSMPNMQQAYPAFVLVPRAEVGSWAHHQYSDLRPSPLSHVMAIIKKLQSEFSIDPKRIYVTGYSMGGYGAFDIVAANPGFFAAAAPLCGGGDAAEAPKMIATPIWAFHGALDANIPVDQSRKMIQAIQKAGGKQIYYTEYPNAGHSVWNEAYQNPAFWQWLFSQRAK